jgi:hypothetical protein
MCVRHAGMHAPAFFFFLNNTFVFLLKNLQQLGFREVSWYTGGIQPKQELLWLTTTRAFHRVKELAFDVYYKKVK